MSDGLLNGKKFRTLNIIDDFNRELLDITIDSSISSYKVITALDSVILWRGKPKSIRVDNGPEFISHNLLDWSNRNGIELKFILLLAAANIVKQKQATFLLCSY